MNIEAIIKEAQGLLLNNSEWKLRYKGYADNLLANIALIKSTRRGFNEFSPLYFYISTTNAKNAKSKLLLDVRYRGQSVATLKANNNDISISTKQQDVKNLRDFNCDIKLNDIAWQEKQVSEFRTFFKKRPNSRNNDNNKKNEEHNVENLLLSEFSKRNSKSKPIIGIQPVKIYETLPAETEKPKQPNQKQQFLETLPPEFTRRDYLAAAKRLNIPDKTAEKHIAKFVQSGLINHFAHDKYLKL